MSGNSGKSTPKNNGAPIHALSPRDGISPAGTRSVAMDLDETIPPGVVLEAAASCVRFVLQAVKIELDFERDTLALLDHYVMTARPAVKERPETLALTAQAVGAYFGQVVRRVHACWWRVDHGDVSAWRLEFHDVFLAFYPVQMAYAALRADPDGADFSSSIELGKEAREALTLRLSALPPVSDMAFYAPSSSLEVLDIAVDAMLALRARNPENARQYTPGDYQRGGRAPTA